MSDIRTRRAVIWILVGFLVLDALVISIGRTGLHEFGGQDPLNGFLAALTFAQAALAAIWWVLAAQRLAVRTLIGLLGIALAAFVLTAAFGPAYLRRGDFWSNLVQIGIDAVWVAAPLVVARVAGAALQLNSEFVSKDRWQLSIRSGLGFTAAVAVIFASDLWFDWSARHRQWHDPIGMVGVALPPLFAIWALLGVGHLRLRLLGLTFVVPVAIALVTAASLGGHFIRYFDNDVYYSSFVIFETFLVATPLYIFRRLGYRFTRRRDVALKHESTVA